MRKPELKNYVYAGLTALFVLGAAILLLVALQNISFIAELLHKISGILAPFAWGAILAYLMSPICSTLENRLNRANNNKHPGLAKALSIFLSLLLLGLMVYIIIMMIVPQLVTSVMSIANSMPDRIAQMNTWLEKLVADNPDLLEYYHSMVTTVTEFANNWIKTSLTPTLQSVIGGVSNGVISVFSWLKNILIGVIVAAYFLSERKRFKLQAKMVINGMLRPAWAEWLIRELNYANQMFNGFLTGKVLDSIIIGILCFACTFFWLPNTMLISVIIGLTNIIPFFGPFIGAVPCALLVLIYSPIKALYFILFVVVLQQFDGNILGPRILGSSTGLSSFWVLFSILLFGGLYGVGGMILGVPAFAVLYDVIKQLVTRGLIHNGRQDLGEEYVENFGTADKASKKPKGSSNLRVQNQRMQDFFQRLERERAEAAAQREAEEKEAEKRKKAETEPPQDAEQ